MIARPVQIRHDAEVLRAAVALFALLSSVGLPIADAIVTSDEPTCCCAAVEETERDSRDDERRDDDGPGCDDRGCCVVGCRLVTSVAWPTVAVATAMRIDVGHTPDVPASAQPLGGIYRPPRS